MSANETRNPESETPNRSAAFEKMDRMYRRQRYFYDLTRRYYLLGRDRLLGKIRPRAGENVLEIGCGTGRNLIILAARFPRTNFFGLDASAEMLKTARVKIDAANLKNITLRAALADDFSCGETFDLPESFDAIFFSYSISMIPVWRESIENALANLKNGRPLYIVDFYDQKNLPVWFQKILQSWLRRFDVQFWNELMPYLEELERAGRGKLKISSVARRYAFIAEFEKSE